jgi:formate hydrogenlyase subunit 3/multisubunit Na+/H+ antiporter MnhD subunit
LVAREQSSGALLLLLGSIAVGMGVVRALMALLREPTPGYVGSEIVEEIEAAAKSEDDQEQEQPEREPRLAAAIIIASLIVCLVLGVLPHLHTNVIRQVAESYTFFDLVSR